MNVLTSLLPAVGEFAAGLDWLAVIETAAILVLAVFLIGGLFRLLFGKGSALTSSVSATLSIALVYLAAILIFLFFPSLRSSMTELPFMAVTTERVFLMDVIHLAPETLYPSVLRLALLAFLVNLLEDILPQGKKFLSWYLWRTATVLAALALYVISCHLIEQYAPEIFGSWAKYILIGCWAVILLTGLSKVLLSLVLTVVNPILGALYALFFSNFLGKQLSKSILTSVLVLVIFHLLYRGGFTQFAFSQFSLVSYGPSCILILIGLYLFGKFL